MTLIPNFERSDFRKDHTRTVALPNGRTEMVYMPPALWEQYEAVLDLEEIEEADIVSVALEERAAQLAANVNASFSECFRLVVTVKANDWRRGYQRYLEENA